MPEEGVGGWRPRRGNDARKTVHNAAVCIAALRFAALRSPRAGRRRWRQEGTGCGGGECGGNRDQQFLRGGQEPDSVCALADVAGLVINVLQESDRPIAGLLQAALDIASADCRMEIADAIGATLGTCIPQAGSTDEHIAIAVSVGLDALMSAAVVASLNALVPWGGCRGFGRVEGGGAHVS